MKCFGPRERTSVFHRRALKRWCTERRASGTGRYDLSVFSAEVIEDLIIGGKGQYTQ